MNVHDIVSVSAQIAGLPPVSSIPFSLGVPLRRRWLRADEPTYAARQRAHRRLSQLVPFPYTMLLTVRVALRIITPVAPGVSTFHARPSWFWRRRLGLGGSLAPGRSVQR